MQTQELSDNPMTISEKAKPQDFVQSFANGLQVIRAFNAEHPKMTLTEVAARCEMTRAMARRLLWTLEKMGYVEVSGRLFCLRPTILELGYAYLGSQRLVAVAQPIMERLSLQVHESCSMSVLEETDIIYVLRIATKKIMEVSLSVGTRLPAYVTSMGRILLGGLSDEELRKRLQQSDVKKLTDHTVTDRKVLAKIIATARDKRWIIVNQELELGLCSAAVPISTRSGKIIAAINVGVPSTTTGIDNLRKNILPELQKAAAEIMNALA